MIKIIFRTNTDSFQDGENFVAADILRTIAKHIETADPRDFGPMEDDPNKRGWEGSVMDPNGNAIGEWTYVPEIDDD